MAELKRNFSQAKMNKDMDERVVASGQYRDANNIQISTSDGSNVGSVQSLLGNTEVTVDVVPDHYCTCVGVLPLPEKDLIYYFVHGGGVAGFRPSIGKDYIIEYDTINNVAKFVFVDIYYSTQAISVDNNTAGENWFIISDNGVATNKFGITEGMLITGTFTDHVSGATINLTGLNNTRVTEIVKIANGWKIYHDYLWSTGNTNIPSSVGDSITFRKEKVLQFYYDNHINAINHLDGMLFWTDGINEPKKIHIERSMSGTGGTTRVKGWDDAQLSSHANNTGISTSTNVFLRSENNADFHTRLTVKRDDAVGFRVVTKRKGDKEQSAELQHITVIKQSPKSCLKLKMSKTALGRTPDASSGNLNPDPNISYGMPADNTGTQIQYKFVTGSGGNFQPYQPGDNIHNFYFDRPVDLRVGDLIMATNEAVSDPSSWDEELTRVRAKIIGGSGTVNQPNSGGSIGPYSLKIISVYDDAPDVDEDWFIMLEPNPALFEFKFPRFSYRWKYTDGEYSTFAPWTEVAFLPGNFDYDASNGYNLGMTNRLRSLELTDYFHEFEMVPHDVVGLDLLYKEDGKPTVYTIKSLTSKDGSPEWPDIATSNYNRGKYILDSELIHAVVPSNQILRPWDNVPKSALAQEMTSNRLLYGNYKQAYNLTDKIDIDVDFENTYTGGVNTSTKTLRTYQIGVVYADEYGRETPVLVPKKGGSITLDKKYSTYCNKLKVKLKYPAAPPSWATNFRYYIKETSNEFYNMAMDRWYNAEDGNVWISFPSAERNKIDEDTFLILKKEHDGENAVTEDARYKAIAIENDAPDYIKTIKKSLATVAINSPSVGSAIAAATNFVIANADFKAGFGDTFIEDDYPTIPAGMLVGRIRAVDGASTITSRYVGVSSIKKIGANFGIKIDEPFGETADATGTLANPVYSIQVRQDVVKHKPEFDGRFFVKIKKDITLEQKILKQLDVNSSLTIVNSFQLRALVPPHNGAIPNVGHPTSSATSSNGGHAQPYNSGTYNAFDTTWSGGLQFNGGGSPDNRFGYCDARGRTKEWWKNMSNGWQQETGAHWFLDGAKHFTSKGPHGNGTFDSGGGGHFNGKNGVDASHTPSARGTGTGCFKHTSSYSRMYLGIKRWYSSDWTSDATAFKNLITTPGTIFRWRDDPSLTAYIVLKRGGWKYTYNWQYGASSCGTPNKVWGERHTMNIMFVKLDGGGPMDPTVWDPLSAYPHDCTEHTGFGVGLGFIDILEQELGDDGGENLSTQSPAIFETEPKEDVGLDIYYEASNSFPLNVNADNNELLTPINSTFTARTSTGAMHLDSDGNDQVYTIRAVNSTDNLDITNITVQPALTDTLAHDTVIKVNRYDNSKINLYVAKATGAYAAGDQVISISTGASPVNLNSSAWQPWRAPHFLGMSLGWRNCWSYSNGIETDRIRDDYNAPQVANGVKASTVLATPYAEEHRSSGLIFSGIFNSTSGVNNLNQFIQAEPITKDLSPRHGSIQALVTRDTNTVVFCEDKVLTVLTNKDALFNADGNSNVTSNQAVLGQAMPINGDYGISTNPESLAVTSDSIFWCDQLRGQVLKLEGNNVIPISEIGMKDYFYDTLKDVQLTNGSYDDKTNEYNLTLKTLVSIGHFRPTPKATVSYNDITKGWTSFKSFSPEDGVSLNNEYYTFNEGSMWKHHINTTRNNFYGTQYYSDITFIFNDDPGAVKSFNTLNYEGTQARITQFTTVSSGGANYTDKEYYNLTSKTGWYLESLTTDLQQVENLEFKDKEGKWFSTVKGVSTTLNNLDEKEFSVQGLGSATVGTTGTPSFVFKFYVQPYHQSADGSTVWDSTADSTKWRVIQPAATNPTSHTQGVAIPAGYRDVEIDNQELRVGNNNIQKYVYSGFDLSAEDFEISGGVVTQVNSHLGWNTTYRWAQNTNGAQWGADAGITHVDFDNLGKPGPGNTLRVRAYYSQFTMPASDRTLNYDIDVRAGVRIPPVSPGGGNLPGGGSSKLRNSSLVISYIP